MNREVYIFWFCYCLKVPTNSLGDFPFPRQEWPRKGTRFPPPSMDAQTCPPSFWFFSLARGARRADKPAQRACSAQRRHSPQGSHLPAFCNCTAARFALVKAQGRVSPARRPEAPKAFGILPAVS